MQTLLLLLLLLRQCGSGCIAAIVAAAVVKLSGVAVVVQADDVIWRWAAEMERKKEVEKKDKR